MTTQSKRKQRTLKSAVSFAGLGLHTGQEVQMKFCPAAANSGIIFRRTDIKEQPEIPASLPSVSDTLRSTTISANGVRIHTVEHVLAAIRAYEIDNLVIEVSNLEPPVGDGNSVAFVDMIEKAGVAEQEQTTEISTLQEPVYWTEKDVHLIALPSNEYRISYTLSYPTSPILHAQFHSVVVNPETFKSEIAPCRTFLLYEEITTLIDKSLIKGGSLANAVVIKDRAVFSKNGLFFPNEMARHKILDVIGDLSLVGFPFHAHIIAIRSGHSSNYQLAKQIHRSIREDHRCNHIQKNTC